ncbi:MAG: M3 family metallopeptidase [Bacteroidales bacterium]|nr:M3 family metallopeptidase [Bacteroidales bacterium]
MTTNNPLLAPFDVPPFPQIHIEHYLPAIQEAAVIRLEEVDLIVANSEEPTFENTIVALENSGKLLSRILGVFYALLHADADDAMMDLSIEVSRILSENASKISLNQALFQKIKAVYDQSSTLNLSDEQTMLLEETYHSFIRNGANLQGEDRKRFRDIKKRLSELTTRFGQNVKKELAGYSLELNADQVDGLPQWLIEQISENAKAQKSRAPYLLTLQAPEYTAFMKFSPHSDLRRQLYLMYSGRNQKGEFSNIEIIKEITSLRLEIAQLLGYDAFADFMLERTMAKTPQRALNLLNSLRDAYMPAMKRELAELRDFAGEEILPWNYSYHSNRLRVERYDFDPEVLRPYFELSAVMRGVFSLAERLYGIRFVEKNDVPVYHHDVKVFQVTDADGSELGLLYTDFFPRAGRKSPGAWMTDFREADGQLRPQVNIVMNFTKPGANRPSLLSPSEVTTFLHEFGHSLHSLLTQVKYTSLAGTNVDRDFVELPSQFHENFFYSRDFLDSFARHYQTGEQLPDELFRKMIASQQFGAAFACIRQLNFAYIDMAFHSVTEPIDDVVAVELDAIKSVEIFPYIPETLIAPSFTHIFSGGYAAGYYSYKWAEVLDADAFALFEQKGIFNPELADSFRKNILEKGGTSPADVLYREFRGKDPDIDALLLRDGIKTIA